VPGLQGNRHQTCSPKAISEPKSGSGTADIRQQLTSAGQAAISPSDIWAAGCNSCGDVGQAPALIEHWNGTAWSINPAPVALGGVSGNTLLTFPSSRLIYVGGFAFAQFGPTSVILKGVESQ
jgi:hypothetical protein